jgi:hypothetical protein
LKFFCQISLDVYVDNNLWELDKFSWSMHIVIACKKAMNIPIFYKIYMSMDRKFQLSNYPTSLIVIHKVLQMKTITCYLLVVAKFEVIQWKFCLWGWNLMAIFNFKTLQIKHHLFQLQISYSIGCCVFTCLLQGQFKYLSWT